MTTAPRCGDVRGYRAHQRDHTPTCRPCKAAQAAWQRAYEIRRYVNRGSLLVDATGTGRRLRALGAIGWCYADVATRLGMSAANMHRLAKQQRVHRDVAAKVAALYDELSMIPGPSPRARQMAKAKGWAPPLAWDDDDIDDPSARPCPGCKDVRPFDVIAVEQAVRGYPARLRPVERAEAVRRLTGLGLSAAQIAARLDVTKRTVVRWRNASGRAAS